MNLFKITTLLAGAILLARCGGDGALNAASGTVTAADVTNTRMTTELTKLMTELMTNIQSPTGTIPGGVTASTVLTLENDPFESCTQITPATLVDADGDGISKLKKYVYNCSNIPYGDDYISNKKGTVLIQDLNDDVATGDGGGYSFEYDLEQNTPGAYESVWSGIYKFERTSTGYEYTSAFKSIFTETHSGQDIEGGFESNYSHKIVSEDSASPWTRGTATSDGFYRIVVNGDDGQGNILDWDFTFKFKTDVVFEQTNTSGCSYYYKEGFMEFTDAGNNTLRYTFTCNSVTFSYNGQAVQAQSQVAAQIL